MSFPNHAKQQVLEAWLSGATVKVGLLDTSTSYTFATDTDEFVSDLPTGAEPTDATYSRQGPFNGADLTFTQDDTDDEGVFDLVDVTFSSLSTTNDIQTVFVYAQDGLGSSGTDDSTPGDDVLLAVFDDDSGDGSGIADLPKPTNGSDFQIQIDSEGLLNISTPT